MADRIEKQVEQQEKERKAQIYQDNSTDAERTIYGKLKRILEHFRDNIFPDWFEIVKMDELYSKEYEA